MKFSRVPIEAAAGAILAHGERTKAGAIKKGRTLAAGDIEALRAAGVDHVTVARLEAGDIVEDIAAARVAAALGGPHTTVSAAFTGRANIYAASAGLALVDRARLDALNALDEGLTVATVPPFERVAAGAMIATVKVIPFALRAGVVDAAESCAKQSPLGIAPFRASVAGLILTRVAATKPNVIAKRGAAIADRLASLGGTIGASVTVPHTPEAVAAAVRDQLAAGLSPILVFAASAIVDRADVVPAGAVAAGGTIVRLGMPVDPGNLLLLARVGDTDLIGIPSCAGSPKLNGFDWVLERVVAGLTPGAAEIGAMGVGGLLKEIGSRPQPRAGDVAIPARRQSAIAAVVLAAGRSTRMAPANKLTATLGGKPIVRHVVEAALASRARPVVVVTGHQEREVRAALAGLDVTIAYNPDFETGMASSLRTGIAALPAQVEGAMVLLGDMPAITGADLDRVATAFAPADGRAIVVPVRDGVRGNPVLWGRGYFGDLLALAGDAGARALLGLHSDELAEVEMASDAVLNDIDTPQALAAARKSSD